MTLGVGALLAATLAYAFWPRPVMVDMGEAVRAPMVVTIDEEAKTRVKDAYVVSAPIAGRLLRVEVEPGDYVQGGDDYMQGGETMIARMLPLVGQAAFVGRAAPDRRVAAKVSPAERFELGQQQVLEDCLFVLQVRRFARLQTLLQVQAVGDDRVNDLGDLLTHWRQSNGRAQRGAGGNGWKAGGAAMELPLNEHRSRFFPPSAARVFRDLRC